MQYKLSRRRRFAQVRTIVTLNFFIIILLRIFFFFPYVCLFEEFMILKGFLTFRALKKRSTFSASRN